MPQPTPHQNKSAGRPLFTPPFRGVYCGATPIATRGSQAQQMCLLALLQRILLVLTTISVLLDYEYKGEWQVNNNG